MSNLKIGDEVYFTKKSAPEFEKYGTAYITANKKYIVVRGGIFSFTIVNDKNRNIFCLRKNCEHLYGGNWIKSKK